MRDDQKLILKNLDLTGLDKETLPDIFVTFE